MLLFSSGRTSCVLFREHRIFLIYGKVGRFGVGKKPFITKKCLYAVAGVDESEWMRNNGDVFEQGYSGTECSVYWVDLAKLIHG